MRNSIFALVLLGAVAVGSGCTEDRWDCRDICQTVQECARADIDLSECTDLCTSYSFASAATEAKAEACNDCLDVNACGAVAICADVCDFVIAPLD